MRGHVRVEINSEAPIHAIFNAEGALSQPLSDEDRLALAPCLTWPRESVFRALHCDGDHLEAAMREARREARELYKEARYPDARPGAALVRSDDKVAR